MNYMTCNTCNNIVQANATGICLGCQMGFAGPQSDAVNMKPPKEERNDGIITVKEEMQRLREREKEIEDALKVTSPKKMDACEPTTDGKGMGSGNAEKQETAQGKEKDQKGPSKRKKAVKARKKQSIPIEKVKLPPTWGMVNGEKF